MPKTEMEVVMEMGVEANMMAEVVAEGYTQRFSELALFSPRMVPKEEDKVESLMDQKVRTYAARQVDNKRRLENTLRDNRVQQRPFKRHNVARAYTAKPSKRQFYAGKLPLCNRCKLHHNGQCTVRCINCKKVGHMVCDCRNPTTVGEQRALMASQRNTVTCYECEKQGHY
nr:reverse transcriptase domain-containing protein [Tanacetum cinerariifolium]